MSDRQPAWQRYRDLLRARPREEVDDELRFHLDMRIAEARRAGLSDDEARAAAHERFGRVNAVEAELAQIHRGRERKRARTEWIADLRQDVAFAARSLRRAPAFAAAAIGTLAIAIGANTAIYSVVHALLIAPLPYAQPEQLVEPANWGFANGELVALREQFHSASDVAAYGGSSANVDDGAIAERLDGATVSSNFFSLLGTPPLIGRTFARDESDPGKNNVIVLSEGLWRRRFSGDTSAIGKRILIDGVPTTVVGVMPEAFAFPLSQTTFWQPFVINRANTASLWISAGHRFVARLRPGIALDVARREIQRIAPLLRHANVVWDPGPDYGKRADLKPLRDTLVGGTRTSLLLLLGCTVLVLIIACVNVANLLLARATARERELAVRAALGGGRGRLLRQLLTESLVVSATGGAIGLALAAAGVRWIVATLPPGVPRASEISMNGAALGFTAALSILTGIAFGLLPAFRATNGRSTGEAVRSGRTGHGVGHQRVSAMLVVAEVAVAVLLTIGAQLLVRSFAELRALDPGFQTTHVLTARVTPAPKSYDAVRADAFYATVLSQIAAMPGIQAVGGVTALPLARPAYSMGTRIEGQFEDFKHTLPNVDHSQFVTPGYLSAMGIRLVAGRAFSEADRMGGEPVAIVSESMAKHFWPEGSAIGKRVGYPYESPWMTIVGVVADTKSDDLREKNAMAMYAPFAQRMISFNRQSELTIVARTTGDPDALGHSMAALITSIDHSVPVSDVRSMGDVVSGSMAWSRFTMVLVTGFALVALLLGAVGIYGVMTYVVSQRAQELSIRCALGATARDITVMVVSRAGLLAGGGAIIGAAGALVAVRPVRSMLYGVSPTDPVAYMTVALLFVGVAVAASAAPARRAARANPASALRGD